MRDRRHAEGSGVTDAAPSPRDGAAVSASRRRWRGLTLVELLVVVLVLAVLAAVAVPVVSSLIWRAHDARAEVELLGLHRQAATYALAEAAMAGGGFDEPAYRRALFEFDPQVGAAGPPEGVSRPADPDGGVPDGGFAELVVLGGESGAEDAPEPSLGPGGADVVDAAGFSSEAYTHVAVEVRDDGDAAGLAMRSRSGACVLVDGEGMDPAARARVEDRPRGDCGAAAAIDDAPDDGEEDGAQDEVVYEDEDLVCEHDDELGVHCYGRNYHGRVGDPEIGEWAARDPQRVLYPGEPDEVSGSESTVVIRDGDRLTVVGDPGVDADPADDDGEPQPGEDRELHEPGVVELPGGFVGAPIRVDAGDRYLVVVDEDGGTWVGGDRSFTPDELTLVALPGDEAATEIACAANFTCAVADSGAAYCMGYHEHGQLGDGTPPRDGDPADAWVAVQHTDPDSGEHADPGDGDTSPLDRAATDGLALALGEWHAAVRLDDGQVAAWGRGVEGQLGVGDGADDPADVGDDAPTSYDRNTARTVADLHPDDGGVGADGHLDDVDELYPAGPATTCAWRDTHNDYACWGHLGADDYTDLPTLDHTVDDRTSATVPRPDHLPDPGDSITGPGEGLADPVDVEWDGPFQGFSGELTDLETDEAGATYFLVTDSGDVVAVAAADATVQWSKSVDAALESVGVGQERVYVGDDAGVLHALDKTSGAEDTSWGDDGRAEVHDDAVAGVVASPARDLVFTASRDTTVRAVEADTGDERTDWGNTAGGGFHADSANHSANALTLSADGETLYAAMGALYGIDADTGAARLTSDGDPWVFDEWSYWSSRDVAHSPVDGWVYVVASGSTSGLRAVHPDTAEGRTDDDGSVWDGGTGTRVAVDVAPGSGTVTSLYRGSFSHIGDGRVIGVDPDSGDRRWAYPDLDDWAFAMAATPDGQTVVVGTRQSVYPISLDDDDEGLPVWERYQGPAPVGGAAAAAPEATTPDWGSPRSSGLGRMSSVAVDRAGDVIAVADRDGAVSGVDVASGDRVFRDATGSEGAETAMHPEAESMLTALDGGRAHDPSDGALLWAFDLPHRDPTATAAAISPSGDLAVAGYDRAYIRAFDPVTGYRYWTTDIREFFTGTSEVAALAFSPDGETVYALRGGWVAAVDTATGTVEWTSERWGDTSEISADLAVSPDGDTLYVASRTFGVIAVRTDGSGDQVMVDDGSGGSEPWHIDATANAVAVNPADGTVYHGSGSALVAADPEDGEELWRVWPFDSSVRAITVTADGAFVYAANRGSSSPWGDDSELYAFDADPDGDGAVVWEE